MKITTKSRTDSCREIILEMIRKKEITNKLPSETELANSLGVSRNTIREAIKPLINEGILTAKHGVGTFVVKTDNSLIHNLTKLDSTTKIIEEQGYKAGTKHITFKKCQPTEKLLSYFNDTKEMFYIERVRTADEENVVFVEDYIPYCEGMDESFSSNPSVPLFKFFEQFDKKVAFSDCSIYSIISPEHIMKKLSLEAPEALILLKQLHYSKEGDPIFYSDSYFLSNKIEFGLIRRCVD